MDIRTDRELKGLKFLLTKLDNAGLTIKEIYLFGSYAKGISHNDIDVALISDKFSGIRFYDIKKILAIVKKYSSNLDLHPFLTSDFYDSDNFFAQEIIENGKRVTIN